MSILIILVGSFFGAFPALAGSALLAPATVLAGTDCAVYNTAPATDGLAVRAYSHIDCPGTLQADWIKGELIETFLPVPIVRDTCVNNTNTSQLSTCANYWYCNGNGTDEYFEKAKGRDVQGNESVWIESVHRNLTC